MSTRPHPERSDRCRAELHVYRIPWVNGRRTSVREKLTLYCDEPAWHVQKKTPHRCRETWERWFLRFGDAVGRETWGGGDDYG